MLKRNLRFFCLFSLNFLGWLFSWYVLASGVVFFNTSAPVLEKMFLMAGVASFLFCSNFTVKNKFLWIIYILLFTKLIYPNDSIGGTLLALCSILLYRRMFVAPILTAIWLLFNPSVSGVLTLGLGMLWLIESKSIRFWGIACIALSSVIYLKITPNPDTFRIDTWKKIFAQYEWNTWFGSGINTFFPRTFEIQQSVLENGFYFAEMRSDLAEIYVTLGAVGALLFICNLVCEYMIGDERRKAFIVALAPTLMFNFGLHTFVGLMLIMAAFRREYDVKG